MAIKLDISAALIVVYCDDCGHWRAAAWTVEEGHERAVSHEQRVHPGQFQAFKAQAKYLSRHAADSVIVEVRAESVPHGNSRPVHSSAGV